MDGASARSKAATCTQDSTNTEKKRTQTSMPQVGFEHTIPIFKRAKTVHALDRAAAVIGSYKTTVVKFDGYFRKVETSLTMSFNLAQLGNYSQVRNTFLSL
jgi:hypothetical protein